jgi:hypothetical protein
MSETAVEQRPSTDIWYDKNPFTDNDEPYKLMDQKLNGAKDFSIIPRSYYDFLWEGIPNDRYLLASIQNSYFLQDNITEILNRLCTECDGVIDVELYPEKYKSRSADAFITTIFNWFDYAINTCRYGYQNERMIDSITRDDIDIFISNITTYCADRLVIWVSRQ